MDRSGMLLPAQALRVAPMFVNELGPAPTRHHRGSTSFLSIARSELAYWFAAIRADAATSG
jgi:hypothetical protein